MGCLIKLGGPSALREHTLEDEGILGVLIKIERCIFSVVEDN